MEIIANKEIKAYLDRIKRNIDSNYQNDFLNGYVSLKDEKAAKKELYLAGQQEFVDNSISLFIDSDKWNNNPYVKNIKFDNLKNNNFSYKKVKIEKGYLFNADAIMDDKDKELKDWMKLRALDKDIETLFLYQNNKEWMMAAPSESFTNDPYAKKAYGDILTFGLGIGYFIYMAMLNKNVNSITVIEKSKEVIELFKEISPWFPNIKLEIINGDAYDYFNKDYLNKFDYIYVDIWQSSNDGRKIIEKLLEQYLPPYEKCDFWIENSCLSVIKTLIYLYYDELVYKHKNKVKSEFTNLMNKTRNYFNNINIKVDNVDILKEYMYNKKIIREILALK